MKLYKVTLQGMSFSATGPTYGAGYVMAADPKEAYEIMRKSVDKWGVGFSWERGLKSVELVADTEQYGECKTIFHVKPFQYTET